MTTTNKQIKILPRPYCVMDVANHVVQHFIDQGHPIPNILLLKILYYLQADSLRKNKGPLFNEAIEKWGYGPVVPEVYSNFKSYGAAPITSTMDYVIVDDTGSWKLIDPAKRDLEKQDILQINALADEIYNKFGENPFQLVIKTQQEPMWQKDEAEIRRGNMHLTYRNAEMQAYFSQQGNWPWQN